MEIKNNKLQKIKTSPLKDVKLRFKLIIGLNNCVSKYEQKLCQDLITGSCVYNM